MTHSPGTGAGRATGKPRKVDDVERVECPARPLGGWHWLTNRGAVTLCRFCRKDWATLDAEVRGMSDPLARLRRLEQLRTDVEVEIRAERNGLLMADIDPDTGGALVVIKGRGGRRELPSPFTYTEREARAAHALHAAGEDSEWVRHGERAYQREKKRTERERKAS